MPINRCLTTEYIETPAHFNGNFDYDNQIYVSAQRHSERTVFSGSVVASCTNTEFHVPLQCSARTSFFIPPLLQHVYPITLAEPIIHLVRRIEDTLFTVRRII
jgi:hypothetical protein